MKFHIDIQRKRAALIKALVDSSVVKQLLRRSNGHLRNFGDKTDFLQAKLGRLTCTQHGLGSYLDEHVALLLAKAYC